MTTSARWFQLVLVIAVLFAVTAIIAMNGWDMRLTSQFYVPGHGFPFGNLQPWRALYRFGEWPAFVTGGLGLIIWLVSFVMPRLAKTRMAALFLALLLIIGPGLLANVTFKDHWGRPRPRQVVQFGGSMAFHQPWQPGPAPKNASFPAGHPTVAFYMSAPYFILRPKRRRQALLWLWGGFSYGCVMGAARIIQGGHFLSDVVWSAGFVYLSALVLAALLHPEKETYMTESESTLYCSQEN
ncbi:phosphatase PAP2 family protein [Trichlorobacter lovleyi]|uniref:phosphatase PAP2 family protein n=1 Tax=Trichlorobacter lovleyi TaxID=313985 RepID=UPI0023F29FCB|nr:phosphatase PAP2 family protein [Trichlorobacter lovleyi]